MNTSSVPTEVISIYNNALELSNKGDFDNALEEYKRAINMFPSFIEAYNNIGEIYSQRGDRQSAISSYMKALKIDRNYRVLLNLGVEHYNNRNFAPALDYFIESLSINPEFLEGNFYVGMVYYNNKNYIEAEKYFKSVTNIDKKHVKANYLLAYIYYEFKEYEKTLVCLEQIKDIAEDKQFINRYYGFCYYHLGDTKKAIKYLTIALESNPEYLKFKDYLEGLTYENKVKEIGDVDAAIKELEKKIMKKKPVLAEATRLSMLYIFKGESNKAEDLLVSFKKKMVS